MPEGKLQGLLSNPAFQVGMGLMQNRADSSYSIPQGILGGLGAAQQSGQAGDERQREEEQRQKLMALLAGQQGGGQPPPQGGLLAGGPQPPLQGAAPPPAGSPPGGLLGPAAGAPPAGPQGQPPPQQGPPPQQQGGREDEIRQVYKLLAGTDPEGAARGYAAYLEGQQLQQGNPAERFLRIYGPVNPRDFTTTSLRKFDDALVATGRPNHSLLERVNDLSTREQTFLHDANTQVAESESSLAKMNNLESRYRQANQSGELEGWAGNVREFLVGAYGGQDQLTQLRTEFHQLKVKNVLGDLPPGPASDRDVAIVMKGWPTATADSEYIADFLKAMQTMKAVELARSSHNAWYIGRNNGETGMNESWQKLKAGYVSRAIAPYRQQAPGAPAPPPTRQATKKRFPKKDAATTPLNDADLLEKYGL